MQQIREEDEAHSLDACTWMCRNGMNGHASCGGGLPAVHAGADGGERDSSHAEAYCNVEAVVVRSRKQAFVDLAGMSIRPHGVNHPFRGQLTGGRGDGLPDRQTVRVLIGTHTATGLQQARPGGGVQRPIDATSTQKR